MMLKNLLRAPSPALGTGVARACYSTTKRTFPSFVKYGTHSAFQVQPVAPAYSPVPGRDYLKTKRLGSMMLSWAPATDPGKGYAYNDKIFFSLSPTEIGLVLEVLDAKLAEVTLTHSPNMNSKPQASDKARRSLLDVKRLAGADGHPLTEFNVVTTNADNVDVTEKVSLNAGEARVLRELLVFALPRLYGFHTALEGSLTVEGTDGASDNGGSWGSSRPKASPSGNGGAAAEWPF